MKTNELIESLAHNLAPVPHNALVRRLALGAGLGTGLSACVMFLWLGVRPDISQAMMTGPFWMKFFFTAALAAFAFWATVQLARPASHAQRMFIAIGVVFALLLGISAVDLMRTGPAGRMPLIMGHSAMVCPWRIAILSVPIFAGTFWSLKALAPTRLLLAGTVAGIASGALGAWVYAFHCNESAAPFVLTFYTLGIALLAATGALVARPILRW